ncbi:MAG: histidine--tRNA ligase [Polyangiaceae bacterium]
MALRAIKGMNDVLPAEIGPWHRVENLFHETMRRAGFGEVRTPLVESTSLFVRTIGEATDVVEKEMYSFTHHDEPLTLRPEGTAGAARAYVEHEMHGKEPVSRWYYAGPMFRAERPQRGRYRQFSQLGAEIFGDAGPACDAEMIDLLVGFLKELKIPDVRVLVNSIGGPNVRVRYKEALVAYLTPLKDSLGADSQRRLSINPLRILDSKHPSDAEAIAGAPSLHDSFDDDDRAHFTALQRYLEALGTPFKIEHRLVRGLDYYTRTLFEIKGATEKLGAGDTLVGGGRYDGMIQELGGPAVPAIGFAAGLERLLIASEETKPVPVADAFIAPLGEKAISEALVLARDLRASGVATLADTRGGSLKSQLRRANALGCHVAMIIGDSEVEKRTVQLKDLEGHEQQEIPRADITRILADRFVKVLAVLLICLFFPKIALAQSGADHGGSGGGDQGAPPPQQTIQRAEPVLGAPDKPLEISKDIQARIGSDADSAIIPAPTGEKHRSFFPYYQETEGDYRFRFLPPLYLEHVRGLPTPQVPDAIPDSQRLYGLLYYQRRSAEQDADIVFPLAWRVRDRENHVLVLGPFAHREAPHEHDNWLAPLFFSGDHTTSGYFHSPALLTYSHWDKDSALTLSGALFFRKRTGTDVDMGVAPLWFHGDNGDTDGARRTYTLMPELLFYHRYRELEDSSMTVAGPLIVASDPKRNILDVAPFFFHIQGKPETGGVTESHTTLFPLFHYGYSPTQRLLIFPGYLRRISPTADTMLTPFFSQATARKGGTTLTAIGPVLPIFYNYTDRDLHTHAFALAPLYYQSDSPRGHDMLTPLYGQFKTYGVSRTDWVAPTLVISTDLHGWETDLHPLIYLGRNDGSSHTVFAPVFWDFTSPVSRTTIGFPLYWRFSDATDDSIVQVAANTVYIQKRVPGGLDWQFHVAPLFSYGEDPQGYFWNVLFGLAGYQREGEYSRIRAFWIPIQTGGPSAPAQPQAAWNQR